jgi:hypothetical protein
VGSADREEDDVSEDGEVRYYTVDEANELLPKIEPLVRLLRDAQEKMDERQNEVMESVPTNGGGAAHREFLEASNAATAALEELEGLSIVVRDPSSGLIDFPAERDGTEVYLCWRLGEDSVAWWHPPETGFAGRQPL